MSGIRLNLEFCCTCLKVGSEDDKFLSLKSTPPEDISYENKLKCCVPEMVLVNTDDCYLCKPCSVALETAYTFRCMCLKTETKLGEFKISHAQNCRSAERNIKLELLEAMCTEEINIDSEQKYDITSAVQPQEAYPASCSTQPENSYSPVLSIESDENDIITDGVADIEDMDVVELLDNSEEVCTTERATKIETVKDQLGSLLTESLGNAIDINIRSFDKGAKNNPEFNSEISIFNSLNAEIEALTKDSLFQQPNLLKRDIQSDITTYVKPNFVQAELKAFDNPPIQTKGMLSDAEILKLSCETIPELHNCTVEALQCQVTLEKITVASLPVKIEGAQNKSERKRILIRDTKGRPFWSYWCDICKRYVHRKDRFNAHVLRHSNIKAYKCEKCREGFFSSESLGKHKKVCQLEKPEINSVAKASTSPKNNTDITRYNVKTPKISPKKHASRKKNRIQRKPQQKQSKIKSIAIKTENNVFKFKRTYVTTKIRRSQRKQTLARRLCNLNDLIFYCELCSYQSYKKQKYQVHMLKHSNDRKFKCEECPKSFFEKWELNRHMRNGHPSTASANHSARTVVQKTMKKRSILKTAAPKIKTKIESDVVATLMEPAITLTVHQETVVTPVIQSIQSLAMATIQDEPIEMSFSCKMCSISFKSRNLLILHTQTHEWKRRCKTCNQEFNSESELREHAQTHESKAPEVILEADIGEMQVEAPPMQPKKKKKKKFFCTICNVEFSCRDHANVHTGAKPYKCKICDKQFAAYSTVRKHRLTHTGPEKAQLSTKAGKRTINPQRKKHACEICKKEFINKDYVYSHTCQSASGESVYRCQICKNAFIGRTALIEHMGLHVSQSVDITE